MIEVGDPLSPEQVRLFRVWSIEKYMTPVEAAALALGIHLEQAAETPGFGKMAERLFYWAQHLDEVRAAREVPTQAEEWEDDTREIGPLDLVRVKAPVDEMSRYRLSRKALKCFFEKHGLRPAFLYPETWKKPGAKPSADLHPRERNALHIIIAALLEKAGIDPNARDAVGRVSRFVEMAGAKLDADTIRKHIRAAAETLESERE